jgi:hypothetical protein
MAATEDKGLIYREISSTCNQHLHHHSNALRYYDIIAQIFLYMTLFLTCLFMPLFVYCD